MTTEPYAAAVGLVERYAAALVSGVPDRPGKLRDRDRMLFVTNIDNPVGKKNLVAIGIGGFSVSEHKALV